MINLPFLKRSAELRKIVANTGWLFADKILRMGVGLFVSVWVARYLGVEQFGTLNFASAFVTLFSTLSTLGLPSLVIRTLTHDPEKRNEILGTTFCLQLLGGMAGLALSVATIFLFRRQDPLTVSLVAILGSVGIFQAFDTIDLWFQSQVQSRYTVAAKNTAFLIFATVKVGLIHLGAPLIAFALATVAEVAVGAIGLVAVYHFQKYSVGKWRWNSLIARDLLNESWPLILSGLAILVYYRIDQLMLGQMLGDAAVGLYSSATRISEMPYFIATAITSSVTPSLFSTKRTNEINYCHKFGKLMAALVAISAVIAILISSFSNEIINIVFGESYAESSQILAIHTWALVFVFLGVGSAPWYIAEGLTTTPVIMALLGTVTNVALNLILIPRYAGVGAAMATCISYGLAAFLGNALLKRTRKLFYIQLKSFYPWTMFLNR